MKKLLLAIGLLVCLESLKAQTKKPTKDETVQYLNKLCQAGLGISKGKEFIINSVDFTYNSLEVKTTPNISISKWSNIPWEELESMEILSSSIWFVKFKTLMPFNSSQPESGQSLAYSSSQPENSFHIYAPADKMESAKKAVMRLVEIAKEENKDPFKD